MANLFEGINLDTAIPYMVKEVKAKGTNDRILPEQLAAIFITILPEYRKEDFPTILGITEQIGYTSITSLSVTGIPSYTYIVGDTGEAINMLRRHIGTIRTYFSRLRDNKQNVQWIPKVIRKVLFPEFETPAKEEGICDWYTRRMDTRTKNEVREGIDGNFDENDLNDKAWSDTSNEIGYVQ